MNELSQMHGDLIFPVPVAHPEYIGDGVYAATDGFGVWLVAEREGRQHAICLEPRELQSLTRYVEFLKSL